MVLDKQIHYMIVFEGALRHFLNTRAAESMELFTTHRGVTSDRPISNLLRSATAKSRTTASMSDRIIVARDGIADCFSIHRVGNQLQAGIRRYIPFA